MHLPNCECMWYLCKMLTCKVKSEDVVLSSANAAALKDAAARSSALLLATLTLITEVVCIASCMQFHLDDPVMWGMRHMLPQVL